LSPAVHSAVLSPLGSFAPTSDISGFVFTGETLPALSRHTPLWLRLPAPVLGQDNHRIFQGILGYSDERIRELEAIEVIGTTPKGVHK
jgi:crotonobetainyl-CoA:carnitine CoA-transferase CaiB-like acyl-CoA transferase